MTQNINADEIGMTQHRRNFLQYNGAGPHNEIKYAGQDAGYFVIDSVTVPELGGVEPQWVPDPIRPRQYKLAGRALTPADLASASFMFLEKHGGIPRQLQKFGCKFNAYENVGVCADLTDFVGGWSDYVLVYSGAIVTDKDFGTRSEFDADTKIQDTISVTLAEVYPIGALGFGEFAGSGIDRQVVDVVYGNKNSCGDCGIENDGTLTIYAISQTSGAGSPGLPAEVHYSVNGGQSFTQTSIDGIGATESVFAIDIVGEYLVVLGADAYYYARIDSDTGVPGTFTKVTTGFLAAGSPVDLYVASAREIFFCGDGGYIYKSTNITNGVSVLSAGDITTNDLNRIHGNETTIVIAGDTNTILVSTNRGATFGLATDTPDGVTANLQAVCVISNRKWFVGSAAGGLYYTLNGGKTWTLNPYAYSLTGQITDIVAVNEDVIFFGHASSTPTATLFSTWNGGRDWAYDRPRIVNWPVFDVPNRLAIPQAADVSIAANNVAVAGLGGNGTDGILLLGVATRI